MSIKDIVVIPCEICCGKGDCYSCEVAKGLQEESNEKKAAHDQLFFKAIPGGYGEGDIFLGLTMPQIRAILKDNKALLHGESKEKSKKEQSKNLEVGMKHARRLVDSKYHEARMSGLLAMVELMERAEKRGDITGMRALYDMYLEFVKAGRVNNWDLVDLSAPRVTGAYLYHIATSDDDDDHTGEVESILEEWACSGDLWLQRVAMLSTFPFVKAGIFSHTLTVATLLLDHKHDLIHKAVGWLLREVGKKDRKVLLDYLRENDHYKTMPRVMLRYAIEHITGDTHYKILKGLPF